MSDMNDGLDIAIVGMAGKFPGAENIESFWELLKNGVEAVSFFSDEELLKAGVDPDLIKDPNYIKSRAIIQDEDKFDANFFDFFPREVEMMDPQHRLFLETAWTALEDAGYHADYFDGLIGLFGGVSLNTYLYSFLMAQKGFVSSAEGYQLSIGNDKDFLTTRASYKMNLTGPSVDVQTACSTSLVAVHLACQNLLNFNCDMALAGGVSVTIPQKQGYYYQEGMILAADGHCRAFDHKASGTISGSGVGMVALKRLEDALDDGDHIYALIKGSAYNNDGSNRVGYTAPSVDGQSNAIANAQAVSGVDSDTISYIEAHGTGTVLGDPIEVTALTQVFREQTERKQFCALGSVKTNIGHLDAAAGVAGLIKTALSLQHKQIPASVNFEKPNPKIDFENSPFFVNDRLRDWQVDPGMPRRAGISSFGIGGTNAHAILEEAPQLTGSDSGRPQQLLLLSAKTKSALDTMAENLLAYLKNNPGQNLADISFTLQVGRKPLNHRRMLVSASVADAARALENHDAKKILNFSHQKDPSAFPVTFMFSGQGSQYVNMCRELYEHEESFRDELDNCFRILSGSCDFDLKTILFPDPGSEEQATEKLNQTYITQPALFVIEYALAKMWMAWGVEPLAMVGHSIGEYVAACLADVFSLEDAVKLVVARGRLMQKMEAGAMISVQMDENDIQPYLSEQVSLAALNAPGVTVLSGTFDAIAVIENNLEDKSVPCRRLHTSHAFHSAMMDSILDEFQTIVAAVTLNEPKLPYVSNVSGTWISTEEALDPAYYARHLRSAVRFMDNIGTLLEDNEAILLEVGPGTTLTTLARRHPSNTLGRTFLSSVRHPRESVSDEAFLLNTIGRLWMANVPINWHDYYGNERRQRLSLPTYPFERKRFWLKGASTSAVGAATSTENTADKKKNIADWFYIPGWKQRNLPLKPFVKSDDKKTWLVFKDTTGLGRNVVDCIKPIAENLIIVESDSTFQERPDNSYTMEVDNAAHYDLLFDSLAKKDLSPDVIIHLFSIEVAHGDNQFEAADNPDFKTVLHLTQSIAKHNFNKPVQLGIVTSHLYEITGYEPYKPGKSVISGLSRVIPQEFQNIHCRIIDIKLPQGVHDPLTGISTGIAAEFAENRDDIVVAYRDRQRWVQTFDALPLPEPTEDSGYLEKGGVYLITGGLGRIALNLSDVLARKYRARLALIEPYDFPVKENRQSWLENHEADHPVSQKIIKVQELEKAGAEVLILKADVSDQNDLAIACETAYEVFNRIDGVFHMAGIVGDQAFKTIPELEVDDWQAQFKTKVNGAWNLAETLPLYKPKFVLLQSSISTILGGLGFGAYAAANAAMDALVYQQNKFAGSQWISVNWDGWNFDPATSNEKGPGAELARMAILADEGMEAFLRILSAPGLSQIIVSTADLQARLDKWINRDSASISAADNPGTETDELHSRPNLATDFVEAESDLQKDIVAIWQKLLGISPVGIYDDFFDLGGNSLMGTQLISQLRETFQVDLPLRSLFEDPTVSGVAQIIGQEKAKSESSEMQTIADLLDQVENISAEQAAELLKKKKND